jgi:hypothetical protein
VLGICHIVVFNLFFHRMPSAGECFEATATKESSMDGYGSEIALVSGLAEGLQGPVNAATCGPSVPIHTGHVAYGHIGTRNGKTSGGTPP